jgi:hypothetical protein
MMRGMDHQQSGMFSYISAERRVPKDHPLRAIRVMVDTALKGTTFHAWTYMQSQLRRTSGWRALATRCHFYISANNYAFDQCRGRRPNCFSTQTSLLSFSFHFCISRDGTNIRRPNRPRISHST